MTREERREKERARDRERYQANKAELLAARKARRRADPEAYRAQARKEKADWKKRRACRIEPGTVPPRAERRAAQYAPFRSRHGIYGATETSYPGSSWQAFADAYNAVW